MGYRKGNRWWRGRRSRSMRFSGAPRRAPTAWWRTGNLPLSDLDIAVTPSAETVVMSASDLIPQPAAVLDRKHVIRVVRIICRILLAVTSGGSSGAGRWTFGFRCADLNGGAVGDPADIRLSSTDDRREDWWWRRSCGFNVNTGMVRSVPFSGDGGETEIVCDFKPNRKIEFGQALVLTHAITEPIAPLANPWSLEASADIQVLVAGVT